jgi:anti-sigma-K factor RskA
MNVKEYIESGIVELYAMNALTPEEKKEFERMSLLYPEISQELRSVEDSLEQYARSNAVNPRPQLRSRIMEGLQKATGGATVGPTRKENEETPQTLTYKYMIAASLAALVISTFASWFFYSRWNDAEDRYSALLNEKNELAINFNVVKATYDETLANLLIIRDELSSVITLQSTDTAHHYQARVYWNKFNRHAYIDVLSLPDPGEDHQYQLWALVQGNPVDAGVFLTGLQSIQRVKDVEEADTWAVTLEPRGGSEKPTLSQLYLLAKNG